MFNELFERLRQGYKTTDFPHTDPQLSNRYKGLPSIQCTQIDCNKCSSICPTNAISFDDKYQIDLGKCIFCGDCLRECPSNNITISDKFRMAVSKKEDLIVSNKGILLVDTQAPETAEKTEISKTDKTAEIAKTTIFQMFNRSLKLRVVSAGGCNACEADVNVLTTIGFDLGQFGVQIVASPRHADGLIVIGPVTKHMETALKKTYDAIPDPKIVIAVGTCAISGGIFQNHPEQNGGVDAILPVDMYIPGCPPNPYTILDGILRILGKAAV